MSESNNTYTFEPTHPFNLEDPKSWAEGVGSMDWDKTHICFTKRSLLEFLKQAGVSVGTNYKELQKLPKHATFGKFSAEATDAAVKDLVEAEVSDPHSEDQEQAVFRPSRKVTQPPGGRSTINFVQGEYEEEDALSLAPPRPKNKIEGAGGSAGKDDEGEEKEGPVLTHTERVTLSSLSIGGDDGEDNGSGETFRPTRKVREHPGGNSTLRGNMFAGFSDE